MTLPRTILMVLLGVWLSGTTLFVVPEGQVAVVARFGDPRRVVTQAGLHVKWPAPIDRIWRVDTRLQLLDPTPSEYLTADKKNVVVDPACAWRVADPVEFWVRTGSVEGASLRLTDVVRSTTGDVLSRQAFDDLVAVGASGIEEAERAVTEAAAARALQDYGIEIAAVRFQRITFPAQNKDAVFARMEQERERISAQIRSEGQEAARRIRADAEKEKAAILAEAERKAREILGAAEAEAARILAEAYAADPELFELTERLRTLEETLNRESVVVLPADHPLLGALAAPPGSEAPEGGEERQ